MHKLLLLAIGTCAWILPSGLMAESPKTVADFGLDPDDWPWWRGPTRNGIANPNQDPPRQWSETRNVLWKAEVPGRGHGSPTVVGDQIFLATADHDSETQMVLCYNRGTGELAWKAPVHREGLETKGNKKASQASSSVACDGERIFINFLNKGAVYTTALTRGGRVIWQTKISDYVTHQGYGSSPAVYGDLLLVSADNKGGGAVAALDRGTGRIVWKSSRPSTPNYTSPIVLKTAGRDQLLFSGCDLVSSFDPATGKRLWQITGATTECVTSAVTDGELVFTSGGYPKNHISAVRADGSGEVVWENNTRVYVPSMIVRDGYLFGTMDAGIAICLSCKTGEPIWRTRLGGTFSSSPVMVGDRIYATNESGRTFVFKASSKRFERVAENQLGDDVMATPAICGSRIFTRVAARSQGKRREMLYCIAQQ